MKIGIYTLKMLHTQSLMYTYSMWREERKKKVALFFPQIFCCLFLCERIIHNRTYTICHGFFFCSWVCVQYNIYPCMLLSKSMRSLCLFAIAKKKILQQTYKYILSNEYTTKAKINPKKRATFKDGTEKKERNNYQYF